MSVDGAQSEGPLGALDLRVIRDGARRPIPWNELAREVDPRLRESVGLEWLERMKQEHLAVGAFSMLATELAEEGCDPTVLWLVTRAAADEVRHADICASVAACLLGDARVQRRVRGVPKIPAHPDATPSARVLLHLVEMCCLSETITGVWFTEALARVTNGTMRAVLESLLEDEIDHGRVGWAYLAVRVREGRAGELAGALPDMLDRIFGRAFEHRRAPSEDDAAIETLGGLSNASATEVLVRTLRDVVMPGFEMFGIDLTAARARIDARGWLASG